MASTEYTEPAAVSRAPAVISLAPNRLSWGAIIGGTVAALGLSALLYSLGLALGLSSIDPENPASVRPSGIFTGIWSLVAALVALFVGGYVAARGAGSASKSSGALHGLVMWGLTVVSGLWLIGNIASAVVSGAAGFGRAAARAVGGAEPAQMAERLGITSEDVVAPVNQRLRAQGLPPVTPDQLEAATRDVIQRGMREGRLDRDQLVQSIAANTALSRADARDVAGRMEAKFAAARADVRTAALEAADATGKALWGVFGALALGLLSAIGGAIVGSSRRHRHRFEPAPVVERGPTGTQREAYP